MSKILILYNPLKPDMSPLNSVLQIFYFIPELRKIIYESRDFGSEIISEIIVFFHYKLI